MQIPLSSVISTALCAGAFSLNLISVEANAASDAKTLNGNTCQSTYGSHAQHFNHDGQGTINISPLTRYVTCPIVRDNRGNTNGLRFALVYVKQAAATRTWCRVTAHTADGTMVDSEWQNRLNSGYLRFYNIDNSAVNGNYSLQCYLGSMSRISTVHWDEHGPTDAP